MKLFKRSLWNQIKPADKGDSSCVFCEYESISQQKLIVWRGKYFYILHNKFPYLGLETHLLAVPYRHVCQTSEMTREEFCELQDVEKFMKNFYGDKKYFSFIRQSWEAKSLNHLHYHFMEGEIWETHIENMLLWQGYERIERPEEA